MTKLHPCCASTHRAIDAAHDLQIEHGFSLDDVLSVQTKVGRSAVDNLAYPDPVDEMQARFSMQYCIATALYQGGLSLTDFTGAAILRPEIRRHMSKISMSAYSATEEHGIERLPHQVTINLRDGRSLKTERLHATGSAAMPLTAGDRRLKFADCMRWAGLNAEKTHEVFLNFEDAASLKHLLNGFF
ncbi:MmgE/PrpD family protein [Sinorhizobium americanum]|uniref:MmgE/PrpD family protein n=1 Tax=Sinorhizobium americanum TaxID=194963 RepID=UPI001F159715|nr:MmgE/PrpD family protein [Sinorhizobium americanum]